MKTTQIPNLECIYSISIVLTSIRSRTEATSLTCAMRSRSDATLLYSPSRCRATALVKMRQKAAQGEQPTAILANLAIHFLIYNRTAKRVVRWRRGRHPIIPFALCIVLKTYKV